MATLLLPEKSRESRDDLLSCALFRWASNQRERDDGENKCSELPAEKHSYSVLAARESFAHLSGEVRQDYRGNEYQRPGTYHDPE